MRACGRARARKLGTTAGVACVVALGLGSEASAAVRYAAPGASGPEPCAETAPCNIEIAIEAAAVQDGDEIVLMPGDYNIFANQITVADAIRIHGASGQPRPQIISSDLNAFFNFDPVQLSDIAIRHTGAGTALFLNGGGTVERVFIHSADGVACGPYANAVLRDSVCWSTDSFSAPGVHMSVSGGGVHNASLRNVTAVATGPVAQGVNVSAGTGSDVSLDARNVIASGVLSDVRATTDSAASTSATLTLDFSNFDTKAQTGTAASASNPGSASNQTAAPALADPAAGDFRQLAGSPTVDAGGVDGLLGATDLDGGPRTTDFDCGAEVQPDIGAYELQPACPDAAPPDTQITKGPKKKTRKKRAKFEFGSTDAGATFQCSLDDGAFEACASPLTERVKKGKHTLEVRAVDAAGNADPTPAEHAWKVKRKRKRKR